MCQRWLNGGGTPLGLSRQWHTATTVENLSAEEVQVTQEG